jgi:hypothetical protein
MTDALHSVIKGSIQSRKRHLRAEMINLQYQRDRSKELALSHQIIASGWCNKCAQG